MSDIDTRLFDTVEDVKITEIKGHDKNPRVGNVDLIAESLEQYGQYRPIIVNRRNNTIVGGHHTWLAARKLGWKNISVAWVDVDEETHRRIMLMDNKSSDIGDYDERLLAELIASLPDITATGYDADEVDELLALIETDADAVISDVTDAIDEERRVERELEESQTFDGSPLGDEPEPGDDDRETYSPPPKNDDLENAPSELGGIVQFSPPEDVIFKGVGPWGIPALKNDMLMTFDELPENLDSWAGSATKDWPDDDQWWLYNWGIDSTSGMKDISKIVLSFYCFDDYFDNWWYYPERYIGKVVNSRIKYALTPNWSQPTQLPKVECLWNLYRARWVGRYMQEAGIKVCPDITWRDGDLDYLERHVLSTLPVGIPLIALQYQTINWEEAVGGIDRAAESLRLVLDTLQPEGLLLYAGPQGREFLPEVLKDYPAIKTMYVGTRMEKLSEQAKGRTRKTTL